METFSLGTKILAGKGAVSALAQLRPRRLLLVTDPYFTKNGTAQRIAREAGAQEFEIFDQVEPDPSVALAAKGVARLKAFGPDLVVALGGGSALDCAKAMVYFAGGCPLAAVPTTSGSGSEVTDFAILTHGGVKHPLVDEKLRPKLAILDSDLLETLPKGLIADTGFDVLAHALEACCGKRAGAISGCLAREAFALAYENLPKSFAGDTSVRLSVHQASAMAGMAFNQAGLGVCHALAHALGGAYHVPHGRLNAILLPAVLEANLPAAQREYAALARHAGFEGATEGLAVRNLKNGLIRLRRELGLPESLAQAGISPGELKDDLIAAALADPCCETNPVPVTAGMLRTILGQVSGRG
jgi:1-propanol dehydrogenase